MLVPLDKDVYGSDCKTLRKNILKKKREKEFREL